MFEHPITNLQIAHQIMQQRIARSDRRGIERCARSVARRRGHDAAPFRNGS